jgi:hypothetical protein
MLDTPLARLTLGWSVVIGMTLLNTWFFGRWLGVSYVGWYLANGVLIGLVSALIALAWGELNRHTGLISSHPLDYVIAWIQLAGLPLSEVNTHLMHASPAAGVRDHFDRMMASGLAALLCAAIIFWIVVIVPAQFFIYLLCGAPGRLFAGSERRVGAHVSERRLHTRVIEPGEPLPAGWWEANFASRPVTVTGILAALLVMAARLAAPG